ncbi:MAG: hypothetical protein AB7R55_00020 [Gemmatimonadales bacterium]
MIHLTLLALALAQAPASDSALRAELRANRHPLALGEASLQLSGSGGDLLVAEGKAAQFFLVGEEHGVAEIPLLTAALVRALAPAGYGRLGIEIGWALADTVNTLVAGPGGEARLAAFSGRHRPGVPFYHLRGEARLLAVAVEAMGGGRDVLWGLDYDIIADRWWLARLRDLAPTPAARAAATRAIAMTDSLLAAALDQKNPGLIQMFGGSDSLFRALREAYRPAPGSDVDRMLAFMSETLAINRLFMTGEGYESNDRRGRLMKTELARYLATVPGDTLPRAIFKFGASHMMRGRTYTNIFDVGGTLSELAELRGHRSFHLLVMGGAGSDHAQIDPTTFTYRPVPTELSNQQHALAPMVAEALPDGWTLFDLRPLRRRLAQLTRHPRLTQVIFGFDALAILTGSRPATPSR